VLLYSHYFVTIQHSQRLGLFLKGDILKRIPLVFAMAKISGFASQRPLETCTAAVKPWNFGHLHLNQ